MVANHLEKEGEDDAIFPCKPFWDCSEILPVYASTTVIPCQYEFNKSASRKWEIQFLFISLLPLLTFTLSPPPSQIDSERNRCYKSLDCFLV